MGGSGDPAQLPGIVPWLTPVAAVGLLLTMIAAVAFQVRRKEPFLPSLIRGGIALVAAIGWVVLP